MSDEHRKGADLIRDMGRTCSLVRSALESLQIAAEVTDDATGSLYVTDAHRVSVGAANSLIIAAMGALSGVEWYVTFGTPYAEDLATIAAANESANDEAEAYFAAAALAPKGDA